MSICLSKDQNWIKGVRIVQSPNCDDRPQDTPIDLIVIHGISLPPNTYGGHYIDDLFCNCLDVEIDPYFKEINQLSVSSHLLVNRLGEITQYVPFTRRAWHAGISHFKGRDKCNDFSIGIELEGCDDDPYEAIQYQVTAGVIKVLKKTWPLIDDDHVVGHCDIAPGRKTDPGPAFNWELLYKQINECQLNTH